MKVLHILHHSVPVTDGYAIRSQHIIRFQSQLQIEPVVVTSSRHKPIPSDNMEVIDGIRYYRSIGDRERRTPFIHEMRRVRSMTARIEEIVDIEKPDILHAHSPFLLGFSAARVARRRKIPFVYEVRGFWEDALVDSGKTSATSLKYRLSQFLEKRVCRSADIVTTISQGLKDDLVLRGIDEQKILLAPNGVEVDRFRRLEPDKDLIADLDLKGCILIGYIGSLFSWEGVEDLIHAAFEVVRHTPNARILVVGGGEREQAIAQLIHDLGADKYVKMIGRVPHEDIARYYSILDVLVYPRVSTRNTELCTPLKPLEAMAMEKAIIGSDVGGVKELFAEGTGLSYRAGDVKDLADKCIKLLSDPVLRENLGKKAKSHVDRTRNWESLVKKYDEVYSEAMISCRHPATDECLKMEWTSQSS